MLIVHEPVKKDDRNSVVQFLDRHFGCILISATLVLIHYLR